jgi:hypothetical protein
MAMFTTSRRSLPVAGTLLLAGTLYACSGYEVQVTSGGKKHHVKVYATGDIED